MNQQKCRLFYYFYYLLNDVNVVVLWFFSLLALGVGLFHLHHVKTQFNYGYCAVSVSKPTLIRSNAHTYTHRTERNQDEIALN